MRRKITCLVLDTDGSKCKWPAMKHKDHCMFHCNFEEINAKLPTLSSVLLDKIADGLVLGSVNIPKGKFDCRPDSLDESYETINEMGYYIIENHKNVCIYCPRYKSKAEKMAFRKMIREKWKRMNDSDNNSKRTDSESDNDLFELCLVLMFGMSILFILAGFYSAKTGFTNIFSNGIKDEL